MHHAALLAHDARVILLAEVITIFANNILWIIGLGRKSVACIMLLCLRMREFPVDVNVGRICSRLGWIPLDAESAVEVSEQTRFGT